MAVLWPQALVYDRVEAGAYPNPIDGVDSAWSLPLTGQLVSPWFAAGALSGGDPSPGPTFNQDAELFKVHGGQVWFDRIHIVPTSIFLGNLLTDQLRTVELFNTTADTVQYTTFVNNTDAGVTITNQPSLPADIGTFSSIVLNIQVSTIGPPDIDGTLDFTIDGLLRQLILTGARVVMLPARPNGPSIKETLEFRTDILQSKDGTEQRVQVRDVPRQIIEIEYFEDGDEAANLRNLLFSWLTRVWGVPVWWEERSLAADASAATFTVSADTTYGDFRVGGVALVFEDQFKFEALEIDSFDSGSITFTSPLSQNYEAGKATVMPVRFAYANPNNTREKHLLLGQSQFTFTFTTLDNVDLADAGAFGVYNGRVLLDEPNLLRGSSISEQWRGEVARLDPVAGPPLQKPRQDTNRLSSRKSFFSSTPQRLWEIRGLAHALKGNVEPFYLPSFRPDLRVVSDIGASATSVTVANIGFTNFVTQRQPFQNLRLLLKDGTAHIREITDSAVIDDDTESIVIDSAFSGLPIDVEDIKRLELVALVRVRNDRVVFEHTRPGQATVTMEVLTVRSDP